MLEKLNNAKFFITLDLSLGYLQVPLSEAAKQKTAFISESQTGQFERCTFGLMNAPKYFANVMDQVLGIAQRKGIAFIFFDDICIFAESWVELLNNLIMVLEMFNEARMTLNLQKCRFGMQSVEYLGFVVGEGVISPGKPKIRVIREFPRPTNVHEVRRFIGLASFLRRFIPQFALIAALLTDLLKESKPFIWTEDQENAFGALKGKLMSEPTLKVFNTKAQITELHTDASAVGLGAMLFQREREGDQLKLVYAISRTSESERLYHSSYLEMLAIAWALQELRSFLIGIKFIIIDCQCLIHLNAWKTQNA